MVFAPDNDRASVDLAIGNFGDGMINIYNLSLKGLRVDARWEGALGDASGKPLVIDGLWALEFGSGTSGFEADEIYFTAGPNDEANGLFGSLAFTGPRSSAPTTETVIRRNERRPLPRRARAPPPGARHASALDGRVQKR